MNEDVLELPWVRNVDFFLSDFLGLVLQWVPVGVHSHQGLDVGALDLEAALVVHLVGFDDSCLGVLEDPNHACQNGRGDLESGGTLVRCEFSGVFDAELGSVPVGILLVPVNQDAELVSAFGDDVLSDDLPLFLGRRSPASKQVVARVHCLFAGMVGVVDGWPVHHFIIFLHAEVVGNGKTFVVSHHVGELRSRSWTPRLDLSVHTCLEQVYAALVTKLMLPPAGWHPFFVSSPSCFCSLIESLRNEPVN